MTFERFTVVRVPFPFSDRNASKNRPALIVSDADVFNLPAGHSMMAMITSASLPWPLDHAIANLTEAGLRVRSTVRFKLFTLDNRLVRSELGRLGADDARAVERALREALGLRHA